MHTKLTSNNNFFRKADLKHLALKCKTKDLFYMRLFNELHLYLHPDTLTNFYTNYVNDIIK